MITEFFENLESPVISLFIHDYAQGMIAMPSSITCSCSEVLESNTVSSNLQLYSRIHVIGIINYAGLVGFMACGDLWGVDSVLLIF